MTAALPATRNGPPSPQTETIATATPVTAQPQSAAPAPAAQTIVTPKVVPTSSAFDLGALVNSIEIPENEQVPSQVPVDLTKLKAAAPKASALDAAKTTKIDPKAAAKAKLEKSKSGTRLGANCHRRRERAWL